MCSSDLCWVEKGRCLGVQVLDGPALRWIKSKAVVLATGGGGHLFANTLITPRFFNQSETCLGSL